jgi:hypothetical protein
VHAAEREQDGEPHRSEKELMVAGMKKLGDGHAKEVAARSCSQRQVQQARGVERGAWAASSRGDRRGSRRRRRLGSADAAARHTAGRRRSAPVTYARGGNGERPLRWQHGGAAQLLPVTG